MAKQFTIPVVIRTQDDGAGGYTTYVYNNEAELLADHPMATGGEVSEDQKRKILDEDDPYENGYIGRDTITVEVDDNGVAKLVGDVSFHVGQ